MAKARDVCWKMRPLFYAQPHAEEKPQRRRMGAASRGEEHSRSIAQPMQKEYAAEAAHGAGEGTRFHARLFRDCREITLSIS